MFQIEISTQRNNVMFKGSEILKYSEISLL